MEEIFSSLYSDYKEMGIQGSVLAIKAATDLARAKSILVFGDNESRIADAIELIDETLPLAEEKLGFASMTTQVLLTTKDRCVFMLGRKEEALRGRVETYEKSVELLEQPAGITGSIAITTGDMNTKLGRHKEAIKYYRSAYNINVELGRKDMAISCLDMLQNEQAALADYDSAEINARKLLEALPEKSPGRATYLRAGQATIGEALIERKEYQKAREILSKALEPTATLGSQKLLELRAKGALAVCDAATGSKADAVKSLLKLIEELNILQETGVTPAQYRWILSRMEKQYSQIQSQHSNSVSGD